MAVGPLISVEEYLDTAYRPDCDYIDGEVLERNVGELSHGRLQSNVIAWFHSREKQWFVKVVSEVRLQVGERRFRIPHVMLLETNAPRKEVVVTATRLCIEILSRRDSLNSIWERTQDYLR